MRTSSLWPFPSCTFSANVSNLIVKEMHLASLFLSAAKLTSEGNGFARAPPRTSSPRRFVVALGQSLGEHSLTMPTDLESLAKEMDALESSSPDRYRYAWKRLTKKQKASGQGPEESFATPQRLPVREIQNRLEPLALAADIRKEDSLVFKLYTECTTVLNLNLGVASGEVSFYSRCVGEHHELRCSSCCGTGRWRSSPSPRLERSCQGRASGWGVWVP